MNLEILGSKTSKALSTSVESYHTSINMTHTTNLYLTRTTSLKLLNPTLFIYLLSNPLIFLYNHILRAQIMLNIHSHLSEYEVIGFLGGHSYQC